MDQLQFWEIMQRGTAEDRDKGSRKRACAKWWMVDCWWLWWRWRHSLFSHAHTILWALKRGFLKIGIGAPWLAFACSSVKYEAKGRLITCHQFCEALCKRDQAVNPQLVGALNHCLPWNFTRSSREAHDLRAPNH